MTAHNDKAKEIRARVGRVRANLEEHRQDLAILKRHCVLGSAWYRHIAKGLSAAEDLIQELDRATDGVPYGEQE